MIRKLCLALAVSIAAASGARAAVLIDDHFDDGVIGTNTLGVGTGFNLAFTGTGSTATESGSLLALNPTGGNIMGISSKNTFNFFNPTGATVVWKVDHYAFNSGSFRAFVGVGDTQNNIGGTWGSPFVTDEAYVWVQLRTLDNPLGAGLQGALLVDKPGQPAGTANVLASWNWNAFDGTAPLTITMNLNQSGYNLGFSDGTAAVTGNWGGYFTAANWSAGARAIASFQAGAPGQLALDRVQVSNVPEPAGLALLIVGGIALSDRRFTRRQA